MEVLLLWQGQKGTRTMMLINLIQWLEEQDQTAIVRFGFGEPHSFRGYYEQLAFEPVENAVIGDMLAHAKSALGKTFTGYKGGEFEMDEHTDCWISEYGTSYQATKIGMTILTYWEDDIRKHKENK